MCFRMCASPCTVILLECERWLLMRTECAHIFYYTLYRLMRIYCYSQMCVRAFHPFHSQNTHEFQRISLFDRLFFISAMAFIAFTMQNENEKNTANIYSKVSLSLAFIVKETLLLPCTRTPENGPRTQQTTHDRERVAQLIKYSD